MYKRTLARSLEMVNLAAMADDGGYAKHNSCAKRRRCNVRRNCDNYNNSCIDSDDDSYSSESSVASTVSTERSNSSSSELLSSDNASIIIDAEKSEHLPSFEDNYQSITTDVCGQESFPIIAWDFDD